MEKIFVHDSDWQTSAKTEQYVYQTLSNSKLHYDGIIYLAFPWANLIDGLVRETELGSRLFAELRILVNEMSDFIGGDNFKVFSVCQHIKFRNHLNLFKDAGVTDLFCSHNFSDEHKILGMNIHPFQLYPVQATPEKQKRRMSLSGDIATSPKKYLYSFVGAYDERYHLTNSRRLIFDTLSADDAFIEERSQWYFENREYQEQVYGQRLSIRELAEEQENEQQYIEILSNSVFSLCPSGTGPNSIRLWEAIEYGSIPVILSDSLALPGNQALWRTGCVFIREDKHAIEAIPGLLGEYRKDPEKMATFISALEELKAQYGLSAFEKEIQKLARRYSEFRKYKKKFILNANVLSNSQTQEWLDFLSCLCSLFSIEACVELVRFHECTCSTPENLTLFANSTEFFDFTEDFVTLFDSQCLSTNIFESFSTIYLRPKNSPRIVHRSIAQTAQVVAEEKTGIDKLVSQSDWSPDCSVITSMFDGDSYIESFLDNVRTWDCIDNIELLITLPSSPGAEHDRLLEFGAVFPSVVYMWRVEDPGLYQVWNDSVRLSSAPFCANANIDDKRSPSHLSSLICALKEHQECDVASAGLRVTDREDLSWETSKDCMVWYKRPSQIYNVDSLIRAHPDRGFVPYNIPHCMPVWRKSVHAKNGYFCEKKFGPSSDWEFWVRCGRNGSTFYLLGEEHGLYYRAPESYWRRSDSIADYENVIKLHHLDENGIPKEHPRIPIAWTMSDAVQAFIQGDVVRASWLLINILSTINSPQQLMKCTRQLELISNRYFGMALDDLKSAAGQASVVQKDFSQCIVTFFSLCIAKATKLSLTIGNFYLAVAAELESSVSRGLGSLVIARICARLGFVNKESNLLKKSYHANSICFWENVNTIYCGERPLNYFIDKLELPSQSHFLRLLEKSEGRIFYYPNYTRANPYQKLLYSNLKKTEINLIGIEADKLFSMESTMQPSDVFHIHWINPFFRTSNLSESIDNRRKFLKLLESLHRRGVKIVWTVHNRYNHETLDRDGERHFRETLAKYSDLILLHHPMILDDLKKEWMPKNAKVEITEHGLYSNEYPIEIDKPTARKQLGLSDDDFVLSMVGQFREYKDLHSKLEVLSECIQQNPRIKVIIAGKINCTKTIANLKQIPDKNLVLVNNFVSGNKLQNYIMPADYMLLSYRDILTSGTFFQAKTFNKPVLAPNIGTLKYYVASGMNGYMYKSLDNLKYVIIALSQSKILQNSPKMVKVKELWPWANSQTYSNLSTGCSSTPLE